jgi:hypothetical protein
MKRTPAIYFHLGLLLLLFTLALPAVAQGSGCIAHRPHYIEGVFEVSYDSGCSGHDEPELDPVSSAPGSARDLTWTVVLPTDGAFPVSATGPTFWFGGTVTDPNSLFGQAFVELQFYPDAVVTNCTPQGGFVVKSAPNTYTACSPVWRVIQHGSKFHENAAFNAMLNDGTGPSNPLVMHAGDTITVHWFTTSAADGYHVNVTDRNTGQSGTIVLNSKEDGPLMPAFDTQEIGNALGWGIVFDTPNSFVWEIGHTSPFTKPADQFCIPGQTICQSYNTPAWAGTSPIQILGVTFGDSSTPANWAVASDFGGIAEILGITLSSNCSAYGGPFCIYPWYSLSTTGAFNFGVDYSNTADDFGQAAQYPQTTECGGPFGPNSTYCAKIVH